MQVQVKDLANAGLAARRIIQIASSISSIQVIYEGKAQPGIRYLGSGGNQKDLEYLYAELGTRVREFDVRSSLLAERFMHAGRIQAEKAYYGIYD
jgi:hypothetical protein